MSNPKETTEAEIVEPSFTDDNHQSSPQSHKKKSHWFLLLLLLLTVSALGLWQAPAPVQKYILTLWDIFTPPSSKFVQDKPIKVQAHRIVPSTITTPSASSEEVARLLAAMDTLKEELQITRHSHQELKQFQQKIEGSQLRTRLHWLISPANHLPQLQLGWEEISLLPNLNADNRHIAQKMRNLAQLKSNQIRNWQQQIDHLSTYLNVPPAINVVPSSDNPWLNWITKQFTIKRSLSAKEKELQRMRVTLLRIHHNMNLERWPDDASWQQIRARLHVYISEQIAAENMPESDQDVALKLPESFEFMDDDIQQLRQAAKQWLGSL